MLMLAGAAPKALNIEGQSGLTGTRILKPLRSSGVAIGCVLLVRMPNAASVPAAAVPVLRNFRRLMVRMDPSTLWPEPVWAHSSSFRIEALACDLRKQPVRPAAPTALKIQSGSNGSLSGPAL